MLPSKLVGKKRMHQISILCYEMNYYNVKVMMRIIITFNEIIMKIWGSLVLLNSATLLFHLPYYLQEIHKYSILY